MKEFINSFDEVLNYRLIIRELFENNLPGVCFMQRKIPKWEIYENKFVVHKTYSNAFIDVAFSVLFVHHSKSYLVNGFYDGEEGVANVWKVRFAPMIRGHWEYKTFSNESDLNGLTGQFECSAPLSKGGLVINPQFPNWFFRADGSPQMIINDGWYPHPGFDNQTDHGAPQFSSPNEYDMQIYLDILSKYRVNMILEFDQIFTRQDSITDPTFNWPWKVVNAEKNQIDKERFNLEFYQRLDRTIEYARQHGIFYGLEILFDKSAWEPREWSHHPWNIKNGGWVEDIDGDGRGWPEIFDLENKKHVKYVKRYVSYTIARVAAYYNIFYLLGAECGNMDPNNEKIFSRWYGYWGDFIALKDPHGRIMTIGDTGERIPIIHNPRNKVTITQEHTTMKDEDEFAKAINSLGERFWKYGHPTVIGEQDRFNCNNYNVERKGYWIAFVSGYIMGRVDRHFAVVEGNRLFESKLFNLSEDPPIYNDLRLMMNFVEKSQVNFWRMVPSDDLLIDNPEGIYCLAEEGFEYLIYFLHGGSAKIELPEGIFSLQWFNPRTGDFTKKRNIKNNYQPVFNAPDCQDWVLHVVFKGYF